MAKTRDVPNELRNFNSFFNTLVRTRDDYRVFNDFLTIFICCFCRGTQEELYHETIANYKKEELYIFAKMMGELMVIYEDAQESGTWADPLGDYYEIITSRFKSSKLGQFFTPKVICDVMAQITVNPEEWGKEVNDPCSGSGRLVLATNKIVKGNFYVLQDIDPICCKMSAINCVMHNINAEIHHFDSLRMEYFGTSYITNFNRTKYKFLHMVIQSTEYQKRAG